MRHWLLVIALALGVGWLVWACCGPSRDEAAAALVDAVQRATADRIVDPPEVEEISARIADFERSGRWDWLRSAGSVVGAVLTTFVGLNRAPNRVFLGVKEAEALERLAYGGRA